MIILPFALVLLMHSVPRQEPDIATVIRRATDYVTKYEAEVGNLIGKEKYVQSTRQLDVPVATGPMKQVKGVMTMTTWSDFMLIKVGQQWVPLREVNDASINGFKVKLCGEKILPINSPQCKKQASNLPPAFDGTAEDNTMLFTSLKADSTKYNIGRVFRETNLPTFALEVLRANEVGRFSFEKEASEKLAGIAVWRVKFRETTGPALVRTTKDENLFSTGTLWIDPETGRILKTDFRVENKIAQPPISSSAVVTYAQDKTRDLLLPNLMTESYETIKDVINCHAEYSNFHPFTIDVNFNVTLPGRKP